MQTPAERGVEDVAQTVKAFILREFLSEESPDQLTDDTPLLSGGILDSIATVKLVIFLEQTFNIEIQPHETVVDNLETIGRIAAFVRSKL
jgi:acyl carrier protein